MRIDVVIASALLGVGATACCGFNYTPSPHPFSTEATISKADLDRVAGYEVAEDEVVDEAICIAACDWYATSEDEHTETCSIAAVPIADAADSGAADTAIESDTSDTGAATYGWQITCAGTDADECVGGRRPLGYLATRSAAVGLGRFLADCARLEAASVVAFEQLAGRLQRLGAPEALVARCLEAAADERRHARMMTALARAEGAAVAPVALAPDCPEDLFSIALHNAVEGCGNETWAALLAHYQAEHARADLRPVYRQLALDETRHAQLSWDLHAFFCTLLSDDEIARIEQARDAALARLGGATGPAEAGLPQGERSAQLAGAFREALAA